MKFKFSSWKGTSPENQLLWVADMCLHSVTNAEVKCDLCPTTKLLCRRAGLMVWSTMRVNLIRCAFHPISYQVLTTGICNNDDVVLNFTTKLEMSKLKQES